LLWDVSLVAVHFVIDRQTDDSIMPIADQTAYSTVRSANKQTESWQYAAHSTCHQSSVTDCFLCRARCRWRVQGLITQLTEAAYRTNSTVAATDRLGRV